MNSIQKEVNKSLNKIYQLIDSDEIFEAGILILEIFDEWCWEANFDAMDEALETVDLSRLPDDALLLAFLSGSYPMRKSLRCRDAAAKRIEQCLRERSNEDVEQLMKNLV